MKQQIPGIQALLFCLLCWPFLAGAETMVMVPGFQAQGMDWRFHRVTPALQSSGWVDGGNYLMTRDGIANHQRFDQRPARVFYTVNLPTTANVQDQARVLDKYLRVIYQQRREPLILVGHSAGGVVARHWLVTSSYVPVSTLITIASPHLGTPLAELSRLFDNSDIVNLVESLGFKHLPKARGLFSDLREERPGTYLHWLNQQPHPAIRYVSVVRNGEELESADLIVPKYSQDMNNVFVLQGHAERWNSHDDHFLGADDGHMLAQILRQR